MVEEDRADRTVCLEYYKPVGRSKRPHLRDYGVNRWDRSDRNNMSPPEDGQGR